MLIKTLLGEILAMSRGYVEAYSQYQDVDLAMLQDMSGYDSGYQYVGPSGEIAFTQLVGILGRSAYDSFIQNMNEATHDDTKAVIVYVDSPGGVVIGVDSARNAVLHVRTKKPIVTLASGIMASAAYWIGSAADKVYTEDKTTAVGSIGVLSRHIDVTKAAEQQGIKITEIVSGKYKNVDSPYWKLDSLAKSTLQEKVD